MPSGKENLASRLLDTAIERGWGDRVALREGGRAWTYNKLRDQAARVSAALRTLRVARGERVALLMRDSLDTAAAIFGVIHAGAVAVPLSELSRPLDVRNYLVDSGAVAAIVHFELEPALDEVRAAIPTLREILCVGGHGPGEREYHTLVRGAAPATDAAPVSPDDLAMILYSSAGRERGPRGVPHAQATPMSAFGSFARGVIDLDDSDRVFSIVRLSTAYGLGTGLFFPLAAGAEALLLPEQPRSEAIFNAIESFEPTVLFATPSVYGQLVRDAGSLNQDKPLDKLRVCVSGAEGMPPKLIPRIRDVLGAEVTVGYGLTEAFQFVLAGTAGSGEVGACGRPVPGFEARIIDDAGNPVGPSVIGTLQIRGPTVLQSYWGNKQTEQFDEGWFITRDRFMMDEQGNYYHCGRHDDLFKVGGKWVSPTEVERVLLANEAVWECAVIGADDEDGLIKPLAFVVPNIGHKPDEMLESELREYVKDELSPYKYPRWIEFVDQLPKGPNGKILRYKLRASKKPRRAETAAE